MLSYVLLTINLLHLLINIHNIKANFKVHITSILRKLSTKGVSRVNIFITV